MWGERTTRCEDVLLERLRVASQADRAVPDPKLDETLDAGLKAYSLAALRQTRSDAIVGPQLLLFALWGGAFLLLTIGMSDVTIASTVLTLAMTRWWSPTCW